LESILCFGLGLLVCSIVLQIVIWRCWPIKNQPARLAMIFILLPGLIIVSLRALSSWHFIPQFWAEWCLVYLLNLSLSLSYMVLYTAVTGSSPSIAILEHVEESMPQGLPREEVAPQWFTDENLTGARHENLENLRLISNSGGIVQLLPRGRLIALCFLTFRRFLGLPDLAKG